MSTGISLMATGRIVWVTGNLFTGRVKTEYNSQTPKLNKLGEQMMEYGFGLAISKASFAQAGPDGALELWNALHGEAQALYPGGQMPPDFAMKYKDGDGVDHKGISFTQRAGYAGHLVFSLSTTIPVKYFKYDTASQQNIMINEGIKCGDYVQVQINVKGHPAIGQGKAGLYLNPMAVQFLGFGEEIINAPNGDQIFGAAMPGMPAGASAQPVGNGQALVGAPAMVAPQAPAAAPAPHHAVLPQAMQPQAAPPMAAPVMPQAAPMPMAQPAAVAPVAYAAPAPVAQHVVPVAAPMPGVPGIPGQ